jgi:glycosyltransferase involved in cell wall biosynthesis
MGVAAVMMVRDEADIIRPVIEHLLAQVDAVYVSDNRSVDGTRDILNSLHDENPGRIVLRDDPEIGYWQADKMTVLARLAFNEGYTWIVPCDADEWWTTTTSWTIRDMLEAQALDVQIVTADLYNYVPTALDNPEESNPVRRIQWRQPAPGALPKVAARAHRSLKIRPGNHDVEYGTKKTLRVGGLLVRHFTWRDEDQYVRKIRNGVEAYAATDLHPSLGQHWRMWEGHTDDDIREHFRTWFYKIDPHADGLVHDPVVA